MVWKFIWCALIIDCSYAGTKNVAKELKMICAGPVSARDKTWFVELSDKGMCCIETLIHLYFNLLFSFSKKHQSAPVLVHEELCQQP